MKKEIRRATEKEIDEYLEMLKAYKPRNAFERVAREQDLKYLRMSDNELYHHFMDSPVTDHGFFQVIVHESGHVPRLFVSGKKFISQGVALRELRA